MSETTGLAALRSAILRAGRSHYVTERPGSEPQATAGCERRDQEPMTSAVAPFVPTTPTYHHPGPNCDGSGHRTCPYSQWAEGEIQRLRAQTTAVLGQPLSWEAALPLVRALRDIAQSSTDREAVDVAVIALRDVFPGGLPTILGTVKL